MNKKERELYLITRAFKPKQKDCGICQSAIQTNGTDRWCANRNCILHPTEWKMTEISRKMAYYLFNSGKEVYRLYSDGSEGLIENDEEIYDHLDEIFGVED